MACEDIQGQRRLEYGLSAVLFLGLFVYLWQGLEPHLLYYGFGVFAVYPVFSWEGSFLYAAFSTPGGPLGAVAALLAQSYSRAWLGAATIAAILAVLWTGLRRLLRSGQAARFRDLAWVPLLLALTIYRYDYENALPALLTVGLSVWTGVLYDALAARTARPQVGLFLVLVGAIYYLAGASAFVFVAIVCLTEALRRRKIARALVQSALAVGAVFVLGRFVFGLEPHGVYTAGTPWDPDKPLHFSPLADWLALVLHVFVPGLVLVAFGSEALLEAEARRGTRREGRKGGPQPVRGLRPARWGLVGPRGRVGLRLLVAAGTMVLCLWFSRTPTHDERALHYYAEQRDWERVLTLAGRMRAKHQFTRSGVFDINRALAHQGRLGSELCAFPQEELKTLFLRFEDMAGRLTRAKTLELYLDLGCLNAAEEAAYELLAHEGPSPPVLEALVKIHLAKGQYETARVMFQALRRHAGSRPYVRRWQPIVADPARAETDPLLQSWRRVRPVRDDTTLGLSPLALRNLLEDTPSHRLAFEYLMACILLKNERAELIRRLPLLKSLGYPQLPRHCAEVLLVHSLLTGTTAEAQGWTIDPEVQRQFWEIRRIVTEGRGDDRTVFETLAPKYGDTYMFYSMFHQCGLK